uniref:Uncharacterized protein n=1 Tax=Cucumis sativus TaxID=3659 RepID=A0A0A0KKU2_CUCSA
MCQHEERQTSDAVAKTSGKHGLHPMSCMHELTENNHLNNDCVYPDSMHVCIGICRATPDVDLDGTLLTNALGVVGNSQRVSWCVRSFLFKNSLPDLEEKRRRSEKNEKVRENRNDHHPPPYAIVVRCASVVAFFFNNYRFLFCFFPLYYF